MYQGKNFLLLLANKVAFVIAPLRFNLTTAQT